MKNIILVLVTISNLFATNIYAETEISTKDGLKINSGDYKFQIGGRIMYDYNNTKLNDFTEEDGFELRRGRIYIRGNVAKNWSFKSQFNVNGDDEALAHEDLYLRYLAWGNKANVTIGKQKMPFGLEELTSSKDISILERSAITELFAIGRAEGVQLHGKKLPSNSTYAIALYGDDSGDDENYGFAARYTVAPVKTENSLLHIGVAYQDLEDVNAVGIELAGVVGSFHVQAEFMDGESGSGSSASEYDGGYVQFAYILTGESRPYKDGKFKRIAPASHAAAWELVLRLEEGNGDYSDIELGAAKAEATTVGVNCYVHKNVRLGLNYSEGEDDDTADKGEELRVRFQLTF